MSLFYQNQILNHRSHLKICTIIQSPNQNNYHPLSFKIRKQQYLLDNPNLDISPQSLSPPPSTHKAGTQAGLSGALIAGDYYK
jgi:hypothetical protein